jgi:hypothetical protein
LQGCEEAQLELLQIKADQTIWHCMQTESGEPVGLLATNTRTTTFWIPMSTCAFDVVFVCCQWESPEWWLWLATTKGGGGWKHSQISTVQL